MEVRTCCKINLGLRVVRRREDGFHDIQTVMLPLRGLYDDLSIKSLDFVSTTPPPYPTPPMPAATSSVLEVSGAENLLDDCPPEKNICMRALRLVQQEFGIGEALIRLHKQVPVGAGLGGGSADAAATLLALNQEFVLELSGAELEELGARLGSDVPFFVRALGRRRSLGGSGAELCTGRGEVMQPVEIDLSGLWIVVAKPEVSISTAEAYAGVTPQEKGHPSLPEILRRPIGECRDLLINDFEASVFARHPEIGRLRDLLYDGGALYAAMSGSGSAVYGIFDRHPPIDLELDIAAEIGPIFFHVEQIKN